ncbi:hypothetical protein SAMN04487950_3848 [Halogranum rubrum]|uniref:Uncharacterized protein n=1 Tax=Halogranum rubrum TaxID=553466 RepID=A0A1I4HUJ6_9EURY|nr:hypothetical protein [Halogranum rubrum]SFL45825.1 hypothetical protein SAMN04487950_3848 [Halogranum rubrum]
MEMGNLKHLREHGPVPTSDLPHEIRAPQRAEGLAVFKLKSGDGRTQSFGGPFRIAYLFDDHEPVEVVRVLFETESHLFGLDRRGLVKLFRGHGRQWSAAASTVLSEESPPNPDRNPGGWEAGETQDCPFCGGDVLKGALPSHLRTCPET